MTNSTGIEPTELGKGPGGNKDDANSRNSRRKTPAVPTTNKPGGNQVLQLPADPAFTSPIN